MVLLLVLLFSARARAIQQWDRFELSLPGPSDGKPFVDVSLTAHFTCGEQSIDVNGFYDGDGVYRIRLMPPTPGTWRYETHSNQPALDHKTGEFTCEKPATDNHGPVRVHNTYHFAYADGTSYKPIGTTSYGWTCQPDAMEEQTLATLKASPFNKIRMSVLPVLNAAKQRSTRSFSVRKELPMAKPDFTPRFNPAYFQHSERRVAQLNDLNVEADLILFTPYNADLGFAQMTRADDDRYVRYVVARLSAYRNVWWSLANEYDLIRTREPKDWDRIGKLIQAEDPSQHLRSIHFSKNMFDPAAAWVTHMSVQNGNAVADFGRSSLYRDACAKPVVYDEVCYEGNLERRWGQLSGEEMTMRSWLGTIGGAYVGHGEVFQEPEGKSWTSRGGTLRGESPVRIAFLKKILDDAPADGIEPIDRFFESNVAGKLGKYYLIYFGNDRPKEWTFELIKDGISDG